MAPNDEFSDEAVIMRRDGIAGVKPAIEACVHAARRVEIRDFTG